MKRAILSAAIGLGTLQLILAAQEPGPAEANAAPQTYEEALEVAQSEHIANLEVALSLALAEEKLDEAIHVRRLIAMERLRAEVTDTKWTFNRPNRPDSIQFHDSRVATTGKGAVGVWEVVDERIVVTKFDRSDDLSLYRFNEETDEYTIKIYSFNPNTEFTGGRKVAAR